MPEAYVAWVTPRGGGGAKVLVRSPKSYTHASNTPSLLLSQGFHGRRKNLERRTPFASDALPFHGRKWEAGSGLEKKNKNGRAAHALFSGGLWCGVELPDSATRAECACAVAGFFSTAPPPQSPLPLPLSPAGALGPAPGPCSPVPAPVGFVSTGRRHPSYVP